MKSFARGRSQLRGATLSALLVGTLPPAIDFPAVRAALIEAKDICRSPAAQIWGRSLCGPILLVDPVTREVVASDPDKKGALQANAGVYTGKLPPEIPVANTAAEWAGVKWTIIMLPLPEDRFLRAKLIGHESWHRVQNDLGFPSSGAGNNHLDTRDGRAWLQLEWRALAAALNAQGGQRREAVSHALLFRGYRRSLFPGAAGEEREMEMHEGLAEFTGVMVSGHPAPAKLVGERNLKEAASQPSFVRSFAYASGPAYGLLLNGVSAEWQRKLVKGDDLGELLQQRLAIDLPKEMGAPAVALAQNYGSADIFVQEERRESERKALVRGYESRFLEGPVLVLPLEKMNMQFDPGNLIPLGAHGTVYPNIKIVDLWGILTVMNGGALMNPTFSKVTVSAPKESAAKTAQGEGWTLELADGWTIDRGEREGDFLLKKAAL